MNTINFTNAVYKATHHTMAMPGDWWPRNERSTPPSVINNFPQQNVAAFIAGYNGSEHSRRKAQWLVMPQGGGVLAIKIRPENFPADPLAFPPVDLELFDDTRVAMQIAEDRNRAILETALTPRHWYIVLVRQTSPGATGTANGQRLGQTPERASVEAVAGPAISPQSKPKAYRVGLSHPQFGMVALSEREFPHDDCESILSRSSACMVGMGVQL